MSRFSGKPLLRGHFHLAAFFVAIGACSMLVARTHANRNLIAAIIYSLSLVGMFGVSALYHRPKWGDTARQWMKRLDHSAIYVLIAGTGTPICLLALPFSIGVMLFATIWFAAACGVLKSLFWTHSPKMVSAILYVGVGWIYVYYARSIALAVGTRSFVLLVLGGLIYTAGAVIYALKRPNPSPTYFGYHEIFHVLVIIAAAMHFMVIDSLVR